MTKISHRIKVLSLFANIGVAEAMFKDINVEVVLANELLVPRAALYKRLYPNADMVCGDILSDETYSELERKAKLYGIDVVMATPPCQGMSTAGQKIKFDERNNLVIPALNLVKSINPKYVVIENVPDFTLTSIIHNGKETLLTDVVKKELECNYIVSVNIINTDDYSVPQTRERMIILATRKDCKKRWTIPAKDSKKVTLRDAIGDIPPIDPFVKDITYSELVKLFPHYEERKAKALSISKWNIPPIHILRQVKAMMYTPTGCTAFDNPDIHKPIKQDGTFVKGYHNTYKRQNWDTPAYTVTMDNRKISSQNNVHPGRPIEKDANGEMKYSDPRALTLYEIMKIMSLPEDWPLPTEVNEAFLRRIIGEGIPPLFMKKLFEQLL